MMMFRLAIDGGLPTRTAHWPAWPHFDAEQIALVTGVLESGRVNFWTGPECRAFEDEYRAYAAAGARAVSVMNGTVALELALRSLGIGSGHEVVVACRTFIASASAVVAVGATPVLCDVDRVTWTASADTISAVLSDATRAVIVVHLGGMPCDMDPIIDLCRAKNLLLVEDCAQAHGARYRGRAVGSMGDAAAFSFCQDKIITTGGEGGLVLYKDDGPAAFAASYRDHGKDLIAVAQPGSREFRYVHERLGTNFRMTEIQAVLGRVQLRRLDDSVVSRRRNAKQLATALEAIDGITVNMPPAWAYHSYYKLDAELDIDRLSGSWTRGRLLDALAAEGVPVGSGSCPDLGHEKAFSGVRGSDDSRPVAADIGRRSMQFQVHPTLSEEHMNDYATAVHKVLEVAVSS